MGSNDVGDLGKAFLGAEKGMFLGSDLVLSMNKEDLFQ